MRIFTFHSSGATEAAALPDALPATGFLWIATERAEFEDRLAELQGTLMRLSGTQLVELHVRDLLNPQLPSHYDYTSQYDVLVFRRLAAFAAGRSSAAADAGRSAQPGRVGVAPPAPTADSLRLRIDTSPVAFAVFDRVLLSVHPADCAVRDTFAARLLAAGGTGGPGGAAPEDSRAVAVARASNSPADLMLRLVNLMVDGFLELRRELTQQVDHWQAELLNPKARFTDWGTMLKARLALHALDEICEDQRAAIQDWIDTLEAEPVAGTPNARRERELLMVRSRDVLEHIERVVHHVRRLEQSAETTLQMHFSAQSNRTNDIMRILTVLTAVFLPLNLIAGIFGMNFESIPLLHKADGFWIAMGAMVVIAIALVVFFWRKRYLERVGGK